MDKEKIASVVKDTVERTKKHVATTREEYKKHKKKLDSNKPLQNVTSFMKTIQKSWVWVAYALLALSALILALRGISPVWSWLLLVLVLGAYSFYLFNGGRYVLYTYWLIVIAPAALVFSFIYGGSVSTVQWQETTCSEYKAMSDIDKSTLERAVLRDRYDNDSPDMVARGAMEGTIRGYCTFSSNDGTQLKAFDL